jgi:hypothetical protein
VLVARGIVAPGRRGLVVGCGVCDDPEFLPGLVAPGGTLLVIARATDEQDPVRDPAVMPWPLSRRELEAIAGGVLTPRSIEKCLDDEEPPKLRWRAEFTRG